MTNNNNDSEATSKAPVYSRAAERKKNNGIGHAITWAVSPICLGILGIIVIGKILPHIASGLFERRTLDSSINRLFYDLHLEIQAMLMGNFSHGNLWVLILIGAVLGIFIKIAFSDEREA